MADHEKPASPKIVHLSEADAARLDARLNGEPSRDAPADDPRDQKLGQLLALIGQCPAETPDAELARRTMDRIREQQNRQRFAEQVNTLAAGGGPSVGGFGWRQAATSAGVALIAVALLLPVLAQNRDLARQLACQTRLHEAAQAFAGYAADHEKTLPRGKVKPGQEWWHVGDPVDHDGGYQSNSAHLYLLVRQQYAEPEDLSCPNNPHARPGQLTEGHRDWPSAKAVSFSYQNQYRPEPIRIDRHPDLAVLADKNPLFVPKAKQLNYDASQPMTAASRLHDGRGQNVLTADGQVQWTVRPVMHEVNRSDNIWVADGIRQYHGNEVPRHAHDSFLVP
jgi:hypothetical protein